MNICSYLKTRIPRLKKLKKFFGNVNIDSIKTENYVDYARNLLFPDLTYYSISSKLRMIIYRYLSFKSLGVEFGFHVFRHTFATELLRKAIPIGIISEILGHKNIKTTMIYLDVQSRDK